MASSSVRVCRHCSTEHCESAQERRIDEPVIDVCVWVCVCARVHAIASVRHTVVRVHFIGERSVAVATERGATVERNQNHGSQGSAIQRHHCNGIIEREPCVM